MTLLIRLVYNEIEPVQRSWITGTEAWLGLRKASKNRIDSEPCWGRLRAPRKTAVIYRQGSCPYNLCFKLSIPASLELHLVSDTRAYGDIGLSPELILFYDLGLAEWARSSYDQRGYFVNRSTFQKLLMNILQISLTL